MPVSGAVLGLEKKGAIKPGGLLGNSLIHTKTCSSSLKPTHLDDVGNTVRRGFNDERMRASEEASVLGQPSGTVIRVFPLPCHSHKVIWDLQPLGIDEDEVASLRDGAIVGTLECRSSYPQHRSRQRS